MLDTIQGLEFETRQNKSNDNIYLVATLFDDEFENFIKEMLFENESEYSKKRNILICERLEFVSLIKETDFLSSKSNQFNKI